MDESLDQAFYLWVGRLAIEWAIPLENVPQHLGKQEVANRLESYPALGKAASRNPVNIQGFGEAAKKCWALAERFDSIRLTEFLGQPGSAEAIEDLVSGFPQDHKAAADRIGKFLEACGSLGYRDPKTRNLNASSAGLLASTILTAVFPHRFVDFRQTRWKDLAEELDYPFFPVPNPAYGDMIVWAGRFAAAVTATSTFHRFWLEGEPLWTIAGICWHANSEYGAERPKDAPVYPYEEDFDEGAMELRSHLIRERNTTVVKKAKELWLQADALLRCDVCEFTFVEKYGEFGEGYIEAHHKKPLHALKAGSKTRVEDLAKVCANCHRMLHVGNQCVEIDDLKGKLRQGP